MGFDCRLYEEAAEFAFQQKNEEDLKQLLRLCGSNRELANKIQNMKAQLGRR